MGVSAEIKELLESADPIAEWQWALIRHMGFVTGSTAFGVGEPDTDIDYVISINTYRSSRITIENLRYSPTEPYVFDGYRSFYVKRENGDVINLLVMDTLFYFKQYRFATETIMECLITGPDKYKERLRNKEFRCGAFETLKIMYKE
jgi:hypothetical protein